MSELGDARTPPAEPHTRDPAWARLQDQISWYDAESKRAMARYKTIKVVQIIAAAIVPVVAGLGISPWVTGSLGSAVVVLESIQQLFQFHEYWISYRTACEALRQEMFLYEARAGQYRSEAQPGVLLAEQIHRIASQEVGRWSSFRSKEKKEHAAQ